MKKALLLFAVGFATYGLQAQVGINTTKPRATLDVARNTSLPDNLPQGLIPPEMTTAERDAMTNVPRGLMIYNTTLNCAQFYNGTEWSCCMGNITYSCQDGSGGSTGGGTGSGAGGIGAVPVYNYLKVDQDKLLLLRSAFNFNGTDYDWEIPSGESITVRLYYNGSFVGGGYMAYSTTAEVPNKEGGTNTLTFSYPAGALSNGYNHESIDATITNTSNTTWKAPLQGENQINDLASFPIKINGVPQGTFKMKVGGYVKDRNYDVQTDGVYKHRFVYSMHSKNVKRVWLNMNLGAEAAKVGSPHFNPIMTKYGATGVHTDENLYGSLYQWQRPTDGHEFRNSQQTNTLLAYNWQATLPSGIIGKFIVSDYNWVYNGSNDTSGANVQLWQGGKPNNPCPTGFHVPTKAEWDDFHETVNGSRGPVPNGDMWYQQYLPNLAAAGNRRGPYGTIEYGGGFGMYWSSDTYNKDNAWSTFWKDEFSTSEKSMTRTHGLSVRCLKD